MADFRTGQSKNGAIINILLHFRALFIKMFLLSFRKRGQTIAEISIAYVFIGLFLGMRYILGRQDNPAYKIDEFIPQTVGSMNGSTANITYFYPGKCY